MIPRRTMLASLASFGLAASGLAQVPKKQAARRKKAAGAADPHGLEAFDTIMDEVLEERQVVGGSLAIAKDGRLVLAKGYGLADVESKRPVTPETLFCIGSVTKAVSGVATLKLVDEGKLRLEAKLVDLLAEFNPPGVEPADPRLREVTVHQILYHGAGIPDRVKGTRRGQDDGEDDEDDASESAEAMYKNLFKQPLDFAPGSQHKYSNSGYLILRLAIEHAAKRPYVPFVREEILAPMGISRIEMEAAKPIPAETGRYVRGPKGLKAAVRNPRNWLASPGDMVRFVTALDGSRGAPFLSKRIYRRMLAPPPPPVTAAPNGKHVGLGWDAVRNLPNGDDYSKNGGKPGVSAWLEHLPNGVSWAFMINTTRADKSDPNPAREIVRRVNQAIDSTKNWPKINLF